MEDNLNTIKNSYIDRINSSNSLKELDEIYLELFGKNGHITLLPKSFSRIGKEELKTLSPLFNKTKQELEVNIEKARGRVRELSYQLLENEEFDLKLETKIKERKGHLHPLTAFEDQIVNLFSKLGFEQFSEAPHIDTDYYNFEVLNIPVGHPARDLWDTFYIANSQELPANSKLLLRTHTSNAQNRIMKLNKPPVGMMVLDRCFRYENTDARHEHTFDQFELVLVDKNLSMANLQFLSEYFLRSVLGKEVKVRMRPKYYPFVEPGVGIDGECMFCDGKGCKVCGGLGWLELAGAGMIHPKVLENAGIDTNKYSGIAWGPGLERILLLKHGINDVRLFRNGDLKFLEKF